jgi:predicted kinase
MQLSAPTLLIVSGAPGSGKTTLARRLAADLRLPLISRDQLKEALADAMGAPADVPASKQLGAGSVAMLYLVARQLLEARVGLILESNFKRGLSEPELRPLVAWGDPALIHCSAPDSVVQRRYGERYVRGERHAAHFDADRAADLAEELAAGHYRPLEIAIPTLVVDTTDGWRPSYEEILDFAALPRASLIS